MPQIFQVFRCYKCLVFQVHQTKKSNKWQCKLCGGKQSIKRHYGIGTAKDCRLHVQKLNALRGEIDENIKIATSDTDEDETPSEGDKNQDEDENNCSITNKSDKMTSKWSEYIEKTEETQEVEKENNILDNNIQIVLEIPKRKRKFKCLRSTTESSSCQTTNCNDTNALNVSKYTASYSKNTISPCALADDEKYKINDLQSITEVPKVAKKTFKVPTIKENSKWSQFVENHEQIIDDQNVNERDKDYGQDDHQNTTHENKLEDLENQLSFLETKKAPINKLSNLHDTYHENKEVQYNVTKETDRTLFELCDDGDLDSILDI